MNPNSIVAGDTDPLVATLSDKRGPVNLTGATVRMFLVQATTGIGHAPFNGDCTVLQGVDSNGRITNRGMVSYAWAAGQTDLAGVYRLRWRVTWSSGKVRTFPNSGPGVSWEIEP